MATWMGCGVGEFPFTYLSLPKGDSDGILKTPDYADVSTDTSPTTTSQSEEVVNQSPNRTNNSSSDDLGSSSTSPKGVDATLYDDEYESEGENFVDVNQLFDSNHINNLESFVLRRSSRHHKMSPKFDNYVLDKKVRYDINYVVLTKKKKKVIFIGFF
nr:hypothetical protein [Tanacetum cinerariifolium]